MDTEKHIPNLDHIAADRRLIEELYSYNKIDRNGRDYALKVLHPNSDWGLWVSRLLLVLGSALILCGTIYFFAFNWAEITPMTKFTVIQVGIVSCLIGALYKSLNKLSGQIFLLSGSVLVGVFLAVFGQIYQTGADAYQLFMGWSALILGWVLISKFSALWVVWLIITNTFIILWWEQGALPDRDMQDMVYVYLVLFNGVFLVLREIAENKGATWLKHNWTRVVLGVTVIAFMLIPMTSFIWDIGNSGESITYSAILGFVGHLLMFYQYRIKKINMWILASLVLSVCIMCEVLALKIITESISGAGSGIFFLMGILTIAIFTTAIVYIRKVINQPNA